MGLLALLDHGINFLAPAAWLALLMPLAGRLFVAAKFPFRAFAGQAVLLFIVGSLVLMLGLLVFGRDGKMLTYLALVIAVASVQTALLRR